MNLNFNELNYFPLCRASHAALTYPIHMKIFTNHFVNVPRSMGCDGVIAYGGGTGKGLDLIRKAYGEYLERHHFFTAVPITAKKQLINIKPPLLAQKLISLCQQIQSSTDDCSTHSFYLTSVYNLINQSISYYPYNAISLNSKKSDAYFLGFNDSCACAAHSSKEAALNNSLREFLERQALLGSWMASAYRYTINPDVLKFMTPYTHLIEKLLDNGELYIFENGINLPAYSILIFYFSKSKQDLVQYSVGGSAGFSLVEALNSALEELWQCFTFQYNVKNAASLEDKAGSAYHLNFQQCNHVDTKKIIPFLKNSRTDTFKLNTAEEITQLKSFTFEEIINTLAGISTEIYYYHHHDPYMGVHYSKIVSPDFFIHMDVEKPINLNNAYAKTIRLTKENAYRIKIPFP